MDRHGAINYKLVTGVAVPLVVALIALIPTFIQRANNDKALRRAQLRILHRTIMHRRRN
jgi:hypothetical protein